jgi:DNA-directed RNA polymerase subunit RPC12/RpoP
MNDVPTIGQSQVIGGPTAKDIIEAPNVVCECGNKVFVEGFIVKRISRILTGNATDTLYPIPVYTCSKCGKIPNEFLEKGNASKILGETEKTE